jgi:tetratricopeptide (TPR) repeat protein
VLDQNPQWGLSALALAQVGQGQLAQAVETYQKLATLEGPGAPGAPGGSEAMVGLGDVAVYEGRFSDAVRILEQGAAADLAVKNSNGAAGKFAALAYAHMSRGQAGSAVVAARKALTGSSDVAIRFAAASTFVEAGELAEARTLMAGLASELQAEPQAYARIVEAEIALKGKESRLAIKLLTDANTLLDTWIGHFDLGRAYLEGGQFPQADSEFDRCIKRRGELFMISSYGHLPPVYYYQGRAREALNSQGFAESYRTYLRIREGAGEDPILALVRRRAGP